MSASVRSSRAWIDASASQYLGLQPFQESSLLHEEQYRHGPVSYDHPFRVSCLESSRPISNQIISLPRGILKKTSLMSAHFADGKINNSEILVSELLIFCVASKLSSS